MHLWTESKICGQKGKSVLLCFQMLILENVIHWAGVVDELEFAKSLLNWCKHGFPELGDTVGRGVRGVLAKVMLMCY